MTPRKNKSGENAWAAPSGSTFSRAIPIRAAIRAGRPRDASKTRAQKCERLCPAEPTANQSATRPSSRKTTTVITLPET
jgi:hypothetical protein